MSEFITPEGRYTIPESVCGHITKDEIQTAIDTVMPMVVDFLSKNADTEEPIIRFEGPADLMKKFSPTLPQKGVGMQGIMEDLQKTLNYSVRTGHVRFFNQLWAGTDVSAVIGEWLTTILNTSMYTYEVSPVFTLMEIEILDRVREMIGYKKEESDGVFCPGGANANLLGVLAARNKHFPELKHDGFCATTKQPVMFTSQHDHYTIKRSASVCGIGTKNTVKVEVDTEGKIIPAKFEEHVQKAIADGKRPFFLNATCGTTVYGAYDRLNELADICEKYDIWMHVDACWGGYCLFSPRTKHLMDGVHRANSVAWTSTKCLGMPQQCAGLMIRHKNALYNCNSMKEDYLFHDSPEKAFDLGDRTLNCGRRVDAFKFWVSWKVNGTDGLAARVDHAFDQARYMTAQIKSMPEKFLFVAEPESLNLCFWYIPPSARGMPEGPEKLEKLDKACITVRRRMQVEGKCLLNYADLPDKTTHFFRMITCNISAQHSDIDFVLAEMDRLGQDL